MNQQPYQNTPDPPAPQTLTSESGLIGYDAHETIAASHCMILMQCPDHLEILTGTDTPNKYIVHDMFMKPIMYAVEGSSHIARQILGEARDFQLSIFDNRRQLLMQSSRYGGGCSCGSDYLEMYHKGRPAGVLTRSFGDSNVNK
uniref:Phospholipid scramblase n=1 Tax=Caenorhabditis japonica TaxID=281687 RepID=A0A8R1ELP9_CAEJA